MASELQTPPPHTRTLQAGPLRFAFDADTAFARRVEVGGREVLRGIYVAVRDEDWDTVPPLIEGMDLHEFAEGFDLTFSARVARPPVDFEWTGRIRGRRTGTLRYEMEGVARSGFRSNRIGFCVLHPGHVAGQACTIEHTDGSSEEGAFPRWIAPHQPFFDIRAVTHAPAPGCSVTVRCEGDVFEMEDQRNWTDASFKTYSRPLERPFPFDVEAGTRVRQSVEVRVTGCAASGRTSPSRSRSVQVRVGGPVGSVAPVGVGAAPTIALDEWSTEQLRALRPAHLHAVVAFERSGWASRLAEACERAAALGAALEVTMVLGAHADRDLEELRRLLGAHRPRVWVWLTVRAGHPVTQAADLLRAREHLQAYAPDALFLAGSTANFTELNRERPALDVADGLCYALNPQAHAFDDASLVETWLGQAATLRSARSFAAGRPVHVGPITLKPQSPPGSEHAGPAGRPGSIDLRQPTRFAAAWTLGSLQHLLTAGADRLTYFEAVGVRGVLAPRGRPLPDAYPAAPGTVFPTYHVLADVAARRGHVLLATAVSEPFSAAALALADGDRLCLLLANPLAERLRVDVRTGRPLTAALAYVLDEASEHEATHDPQAFRARAGRPVPTVDEGFEWMLEPHAYVRFELTPAHGGGSDG